MADEIKSNLVFLAENTTNLQVVLIYCVQNGILSNDEMERIMAGQTTLDRNLKFWNLMERKDWRHWKSSVMNFLRLTSNAHCCDKIEKRRSGEHEYTRKLILDGKWWPKAFQQRKYNGITLVEDLKKNLEKSKNCSTVINQETTVSGMGGVGKTTTAKWFANHYQDLYDHIIWIDCGEGALVNSFMDLAAELEINTTLRLNLLAKKCFAKLDGCKCLWIYDNAECYQGNQGIREVLPKNSSFETIITSRTKDWGSETGDGKIPQLHLCEFSHIESMEFLQKNLNDVRLYSEDDQKEMCELLGNLPVALQIAVTTVNSKKISMRQYIERLKQTDHIINQNFDDYEKSINKAMKISLDIIRNHESDHKQTAYKILLIFGYISPDHIEFPFFAAVENLSQFETDEAMELLEKYSLVSLKSNRYCSIHRLLQQVIRHNGKKEENSILTNILSVEGFLDYKLLPFTYASNEIQNLFPKIRAQLVDHYKLREMVNQGKFLEAVELSRLIRDTLGSPTAAYNHAICLGKLNAFSEAFVALQELYTKIKLLPNSNMPEGRFLIPSYVSNLLAFTDDTGIVNLKKEIKSNFVAGLLLLEFERQGNISEINALLTQETELVVFKTVYTLNSLMMILKSCNSLFGYQLCNSQKYYVLKMRKRSNGRKIKLMNCALSEDFPNDVNELELESVDFLNEEGERLKTFDISHLISSNLRKLDNNCRQSTEFIIQMSSLISCYCINLQNCAIILNEGIHVHPRETDLQMNRFIKNEKEVESICVNEFLDFQELLRLNLYGKNLSVDFSVPFNVRKVFLLGFTSLDWRNANCTIQDLTIMDSEIPDDVDHDFGIALNTLHLRYCTVKTNTLYYLTKNTKNVILFNVTLECDDLTSGNNQKRITGETVRLTDPKLICGSFEVDTLVVNKIFDLAETVKELQVSCSEEHTTTIVLDLKEEVCMGELDLQRVKLINWDLSTSTVTKLILRTIDVKNIFNSSLKIDGELTILDSHADVVSLSNISKTAQKVSVWRTTVDLPKILQPTTYYLDSPVKELEFHEILFAVDGEEIENLEINDFANITQLTSLKFYAGEGKNVITLDMSQPISFDVLSLGNVHLLNWEKGNGNIKQLTLHEVPLLKESQIRIDSLTFGNSSIELSCLPASIERITLGSKCTVTCKNPSVLKNLNYVQLPCEHSMLTHFFICPRLSTIELFEFKGRLELSLQWIPETVKTIKLRQQPMNSGYPGLAITGNEKRQFETVIFENCNLREIVTALDKLQPNNIFIDSKAQPIYLRNADVVLPLIFQPYKMVAIGYFTWENDEEFEDSIIAKYVDVRGNYFIFENQKGRMVPQSEFEKMMIL